MPEMNICFETILSTYAYGCYIIYMFWSLILTSEKNMFGCHIGFKSAHFHFQLQQQHLVLRLYQPQT